MHILLRVKSSSSLAENHYSKTLKTCPPPSLGVQLIHYIAGGNQMPDFKGGPLADTVSSGSLKQQETSPKLTRRRSKNLPLLGE